MTWVKQESNIWTPEKKEEELIGIVIDIQEGIYGKQYLIKDDDGVVNATPSHKFLINRMVAAKVGDKVKIVFTGTEPTGKKGQSPMNLYDVWIDRT